MTAASPSSMGSTDTPTSTLTRAPWHRRGWTARALLAVVRFYQNAISPLFLPRCRYFPTCSAYALEAVQLHGASRGSWLAVRRLGRCHPWTPGGVDHVPGAAPPERRDHQPVTGSAAEHRRD